MEKNNDETVLISIGKIMDKMDFDNPAHLEYIVQKLDGNKSFQASAYGRRFIAKVKKLLENRTADDVTKVNALINKSNKKTEEFFRDVDDKNGTDTEHTSKKVTLEMDATQLAVGDKYFVADKNTRTAGNTEKNLILCFLEKTSQSSYIDDCDVNLRL